MAYPESLHDILNSRDDNAYTFTVNTAAVSVPLVNPVNLPNTYLQISSGESLVEQQDNITVLEIGVRLPYCFRFVESMLDLQFQYQVDPAGAKVNVFERIGRYGRILIPKHETLSIDTFIPFPAQAADYHINYNFNSVHNISMIGVPDDLDTLTFEVSVWMKIKHSLAMQ